MAQPIICDMCEQEAGVFMITNTVNGDTMAVGVGCIGLFAEGVITATEMAADADQDTVTDPETDEPTDEPTDARPPMSDAASVAMGRDGLEAQPDDTPTEG